MLILRPKTFLILYPLFENSTTRIAINEGDCGPYGSCQTRGNGNDKFMVSIGDPWGESGG